MAAQRAGLAKALEAVVEAAGMRGGDLASGSQRSVGLFMSVPLGVLAAHHGGPSAESPA